LPTVIKEARALPNPERFQQRVREARDTSEATLHKVKDFKVKKHKEPPLPLVTSRKDHSIQDKTKPGSPRVILTLKRPLPKESAIITNTITNVAEPRDLHDSTPIIALPLPKASASRPIARSTRLRRADAEDNSKHRILKMWLGLLPTNGSEQKLEPKGEPVLPPSPIDRCTDSSIGRPNQNQKNHQRFPNPTALRPSSAAAYSRMNIIASKKATVRGNRRVSVSRKADRMTARDDRRTKSGKKLSNVQKALLGQ
jgi:hypothetical protein